MESREGLRLRDWQEALDVLDACNLSGVVLAWARVMHRICAEDDGGGYGTDWKNTHPINVLYANKCAALTRQYCAPLTDSYLPKSMFALAYDYVNAVIAEPLRCMPMTPGSDRSTHCENPEHHARKVDADAQAPFTL
jgi:hypothetical protein